jgi:hypothetical protein
MPIDVGSSSDEESGAARAPGVMLSRLTGSLNGLLARGVARYGADDAIELLLDRDEAATGGMVTISMRVPVRCPACAGRGAGCARCGDTGEIEELFAAWLAVRPGLADGAELTPSATLPGMLRPVRFRARRAG